MARPRYTVYGLFAGGHCFWVSTTSLPLEERLAKHLACLDGEGELITEFHQHLAKVRTRVKIKPLEVLETDGHLARAEAKWIKEFLNTGMKVLNPVSDIPTRSPGPKLKVEKKIVEPKFGITDADIVRVRKATGVRFSLPKMSDRSEKVHANHVSKGTYSTSCHQCYLHANTGSNNGVE